MSIRTQVVTESEFQQAFSSVKQALFDYVDAVYGWDDDFQQDRLRHDYELTWYHWLYEKNTRIGLVCYRKKESRLHLHLMIVFTQFQGNGIGRHAMDFLINEARRMACDQISLSSFTQNKRALAFYESLGFVTDSTEENFINMSFQLSQ
ncbi:GNAT family N-acetyltransferase [Marinomonas sp. PE14-40]|uniref:GNAT family N-acetyltransferase n=1 Tax=Marinomonas sp. PE14-40 TaxID=3060621 RepID=UPI003F67A442